MSRNVPPKRRAGWLHTVLTVLVMAAQLVVAFAPLAESRDRRMDSQVEAGGAQTHHAHNEAECAACQARSFHGPASRVALPAVAVAAPRDRIFADADLAVSRESHSPSNPRAPPSVL
jgi:hypothetical protein